MPLKLRLLPMHAGKTRWLINVLDINSRYTPCLYVNTVKDVRAGEAAAFSTHDPFLNGNIENVTFKKVLRLGDISLDEYSKYRVICIDEANFYEDIPEVVIKLLDLYDPDVYVAGLNGSSERKLLGRVHELLPHVLPDAEVICSACATLGRKTTAIYSKRLTDETDEFVVTDEGCPDKYISVCREHYFTERSELSTMISSKFRPNNNISA